MSMNDILQVQALVDRDKSEEDVILKLQFHDIHLLCSLARIKVYLLGEILKLGI